MDTASKLLSTQRVYVKGKFLYEGGQKRYVYGVTYGTFAPDTNGIQFPRAEIVEYDFAMMREHGINTVRTYTAPPMYLLDIAKAYNLKVMAGLPWEQHITFLDDEKRVRDIIQRIKDSVKSFAGHPALLCYTIGNEIPATIVRWYGPKKIEQFLFKLYKAVKSIDPLGLVTYVNYPTTEYLTFPWSPDIH